MTHPHPLIDRILHHGGATPGLLVAERDAAVAREFRAIKEAEDARHEVVTLTAIVAEGLGREARLTDALRGCEIRAAYYRRRLRALGHPVLRVVEGEE